MAYKDVAQMANTGSLNQRITACAATEGEKAPDGWTSQHRWEMVAAPGWDAAWAYALASKPDADPEEVGADGGVITDGMILSQFQFIQQEAAPKDTPVEEGFETSE